MFAHLFLGQDPKLGDEAADFGNATLQRLRDVIAHTHAIQDGLLARVLNPASLQSKFHGCIFTGLHKMNRR